MGTSSISICKKKILNTLEASPALLSLLGAEDPGESLLYQRIFPFFYIPDETAAPGAYLILKVNIPKQLDTLTAQLTLTIGAVAHRENMALEDREETRTDAMGEIIGQLFTGMEGFGLGPLKLRSDLEQPLNATHICRSLTFVTEDFLSDGRKG